MLALYHAEPLANSMKVLLALEEKGLAFDSHYIDLHRFAQHEPEFLAINPAGQVPVLVHDGAVIVESTVISEYLEDVFPDAPLLPADPVARAHARATVKYVDDHVMPSVSMIAWHFRVREVAKRTDPEEMERRIARIPLAAQRAKWRTIAGKSFTDEELAVSRDRIAEAAQRFEAALTASEWLAGDYGLADINAFSHVGARFAWFPDAFNPQATPRCLTWAERMEARPAVIKVQAMPNLTGQSLSGTAPIEQEELADVVHD
jgi:glutathione S-transferase